MDNRPSSQRGVFDKAAIALSGLCLAHCLLLPGAVILLPMLSQFDVGHFHVQMLLVVVPVSLLAFGLGFRRHQNLAIVGWGLIGIGTMLFGGTYAHNNYGVLADTVLTVSGSIVLATAHFFNNRLTRHVRANTLSEE